MTVRPRYPFVALGVPLVLLFLFAYGPIVILLIGGMAAGALGCGISIHFAAGRCPFMGSISRHSWWLWSLRLPRLFYGPDGNHLAASGLWSL